MTIHGVVQLSNIAFLTVGIWRYDVTKLNTVVVSHCSKCCCCRFTITRPHVSGVNINLPLKKFFCLLKSWGGYPKVRPAAIIYATYTHHSFPNLCWCIFQNKLGQKKNNNKFSLQVVYSQPMLQLCYCIRLQVKVIWVIFAISGTRKKSSCIIRHRQLEYLAVYGRACMGVPVGELQSTMAPTTDYCLSRLYGDWASDTFFVTHRNVTTWVAPRSIREARLKIVLVTCSDSTASPDIIYDRIDDDDQHKNCNYDSKYQPKWTWIAAWLICRLHIKHPHAKATWKIHTHIHSIYPYYVQN